MEAKEEVTMMRRTEGPPYWAVAERMARLPLMAGSRRSALLEETVRVKGEATWITPVMGRGGESKAGAKRDGLVMSGTSAKESCEAWEGNLARMPGMEREERTTPRTW